MPDHGGFFDPELVPSYKQYLISAHSIVSAVEKGMDDPEDTLMVQLTTPEVGAMTLGTLLVMRLFPELVPVCSRLNMKLIELAQAQEFFGRGRTEEEE